jgi:hypothetical protein
MLACCVSVWHGSKVLSSKQAGKVPLSAEFVGFNYRLKRFHPWGSGALPTGFEASTHWLQGLYSLASGDLPTDFGVFICRGIGTYPVVI